MERVGKGMSEEKARLNLLLDQDLYDNFREVSKNEGLTMSKHLRLLIEEKVKKVNLNEDQIDMDTKGDSNENTSTSYSMGQINKALNVFRVALKQND